VKISSLLPSAAAFGLLAAAVFAATTAVQATQQQPAPQAAPATPAEAGPPQQGVPPGAPPMRNFPPPTNLKVLPKDLTGHEVREIMQKWAGSLGVECDTCHVADPSHLDARGRPAMNFPDDSKPDKQIARLMYTMTQQINTNTISKVMDMDKDNEGTPVTCGTCHRGHKMPEEFVIPKEGPHGGPGEGPGGPPAGAMPPDGMTPPSGAPPPN
jgi:hypothetical protein